MYEPTKEELTTGQWMRFEYHKKTREAFVMKAGLPCFQVRKDGKPEAGWRSFKPEKMVAIETCDPDWDKLPKDWQPLLAEFK